MKQGMATKMLTPRKGATILIAVLIGSAAVAWKAQGQPNLPDLTISMNAVPKNPVPVGMGYEIQIIVGNTLPPEVPVRRADPSIPVPRGGGRETTRGGGREITLGADIREVGLRVDWSEAGPLSWQIQPWAIINCVHQYRSGLLCNIGPLKRGGQWMITLVFWRNIFPGEIPDMDPLVSNLISAQIDYNNKIAERDEWNNTAFVDVQFASGP